MRQDAPRRIVCLTEEPTEVLHLLGEGERIVGISAWTCRPPGAREKAPIVSGFVGGNVKRIVELEPDLVIGFSDIQADLAAQLIRANLQVLITNQRSVAEVLDAILLLGRVVGREARAQELVAGYRARLEAARARGAALPRRPRVYFEEWPDPMISAIRWVSELIDVAGGQDVFAERSSGKLAKERFVQADEVVARDPEVIVASWCGKPVDRSAIAARGGWGDVSAVKSGRIHEIESALILQPGPAALTDGLDALERIVGEAAHGGAARC
jgi:iron complex transport system substrate-binding protein